MSEWQEYSTTTNGVVVPGYGDPISVVRGLAFFDDAEREPMPEMLAAVTWSNIRDGISEALRAVLR